MLKKLFDHFSSHVTIWTWAWPYLGSVVGVGVVSGYIARATDWIAPWGPLGWWTIALLGAMFATLIFFLSSFAYLKIVDAKIRRKLFSSSDKINTLDTLFDGKKIHISDLAYPFMPIVKNKVFQNCDLLGPTNILFVGTTSVSGCGGELNQAAMIDLSEINIPYNTVIFQDCVIRNCNLYQTTMFVQDDNYDQFASGWKRLPWITKRPR